MKPDEVNKNNLTFEVWLSALAVLPIGFREWRPARDLHWKRGDNPHLAAREYMETNAYKEARKKQARFLVR